MVKAPSKIPHSSIQGNGKATKDMEEVNKLINRPEIITKASTSMTNIMVKGLSKLEISFTQDFLLREFLMEKGPSNTEMDKPLWVNSETGKELLADTPCQMEATTMDSTKMEFLTGSASLGGAMELGTKEAGGEESRKAKESRLSKAVES